MYISKTRTILQESTHRRADTFLVRGGMETNRLHVRPFQLRWRDDHDGSLFLSIIRGSVNLLECLMIYVFVINLFRTHLLAIYE